MAGKKEYKGDGQLLYTAVFKLNFSVTDVMQRLQCARQTVYNYYESEVLPDELKSKIESAFGVESGDIFGLKSNTPAKITGEDLRRKKAFAPTEDPGLIYVPIAAQMGYARAYADPIYISHLERLYIPGLPYKGDKYRYFEGEGDSMEPTIIEGMQVIGEHIEQQDWKHAHNYYIHVIITSNRLLIKRIFKKDEATWVLISDNEDYPQEILKVEEIKELWYVKRILDWRMPPPKTIKITV